MKVLRSALLALTLVGALAGSAAARLHPDEDIPARKARAERQTGEDRSAEPRTDPKPDPAPKPDPVPKPEPKPAPKPEPTPEPTPADKPADQPAAHPGDKPVDQPADKPADHPPDKGSADKKGKDDAKDAKDAKKDEKEKWDVNNAPGPSSEAVIDVAEGTWVSVDVSPDGKEIAFDLLGDIYTVPVAGGEARALTHDVAWQMQPRYSPDGKAIAFTSDQGGGDNLWLMDRDGSHQRQVTKESYRLLNEPAWTPDGQYLVGRKHFTSTRSAGAGEMWLYHRSGGDGVQLTKRRTDQKDSGEPAFSPDGRYLYYSDDITPGKIFEYNKDSNGEIYDIQRLDRTTGETERYITGPGGAVRPTPSPDGRLIAFVRRVRAKSVLHLFDTRSGEAWPIYDGLDRDMQETWAIHGVYPAMAWTPDSRAIVLWAGGKIRRVDAATRQVRDVPFHVHATRRVTKALRFPVEVAPERFDVKMLRWVEVSPRGDRVVYQALGHLWVRPLPQGVPRRLTRDDDVSEFWPSFSRDGRAVVYTAWNDRKLGSVRVVSAEGGAGRVITDRPGHYVEPVFTPDGKQVVYRRTGSDGLRSRTWEQDQGIYRVPAAGGKSTLVTKDGFQPHFGAAADRVFLTTFDDDQKAKLLSVDLDGGHERQHLASENATEIRLSPDGRWVAWSERFNAYIAPFVPTGKAVDLAPKMTSLPAAKVSRDAGEYLRWSGDSRRLHWSLGPELYSRDLTDAFAFLSGAPEKLPEIPAHGQPIGFQAASDRPSGTVAVVGGKLITMRGDEVIDDGAVVIEGNRIKAVGRRAEVAVPAGAYVVDARGKTVMPGLIDVHWHGGFGQEGLIPQQSWINAGSLAFGVTTLHDPSNDTDTVFAASELARAGLITAPRIFSTGTILYGATAPFKAEIDSLDDARSHLRRMKAVGAWSVKSYNQPRREQRQQVLTAARELGMMVVPEGGSQFEHDMTMVIDGHTGVEHTLPVGRIYDDVRQLWRATEVGYTPTLGVAYGGLSGELYWYDKTPVWQNERLLAFVPREVIDARSRRRPTAPEEEYNHIEEARLAKQLADQGVGVNLGAHGQREGLAAHWEIWMLVQGGMTPHQALRSATLTGAHYLGLDRDLGSLETGKLGDLIVVDGDPLADIRSSEKVWRVIQNGRVYDGATLDQLGNHPKKRQPMYFQLPQPAFGASALGAAAANP
jgi:imidazolonepropionase-like amidohydrolase/Tol biopolymer transport system component